MKFPKKIKLIITKKLIDKAIAKKRDPVFLALKDKGYKTTLIGYNQIYIYPAIDSYASVDYEIPEEGRIFLNKFDKSQPVKPIKFTITKIRE